MTEAMIGGELVQYGFAGFAFLLAGIILLLIKEWRKDAREARNDVMSFGNKALEVITKNTAAFVGHRESLNGLKEATKENTTVLRSINNGKGR